MTLRSKFILLIAGAIVMPVLTMGGIYLLINNYMALTNPGTIISSFEEKLEQVEIAQDIPALAEEYGESFFAFIIDETDLGEVSLIGSGKKDFVHQLAANQYIHELEDGRKVMIIFGHDFTRSDKRLIPVIFLVTSLLALSLMSLFIIRSINNSISRLEGATKDIARGNLDVEIDTRGQDSFGSLARSLDTMRDQIKMEYDRRNRFFMGISHDLKTPLSSITGYADALLEGMADDRETMNKYLGIIKDKSHQLEEGITRIIHYMKLSNFEFQTNLEEKSLTAFLTSFMNVYKEEAGFHGHSLEGSIELPDDLLLPFDEQLLWRALENLLQNAYRYGYADEPVKFICHKEYGNIVLDVENRGEQIPPEQVELLFEPFYRGDKSRRSDGFGLGLASVKSIVESHDWSIKVDSKEKLTRFSIIIPQEKSRRGPA